MQQQQQVAPTNQAEERKQAQPVQASFPEPNIIGNIEDQPHNGGFGAF